MLEFEEEQRADAEMGCDLIRVANGAISNEKNHYWEDIYLRTESER